MRRAALCTFASVLAAAAWGTTAVRTRDEPHEVHDLPSRVAEQAAWRMNVSAETTRLGTELEIVADFDLQPLLDHFGSRVDVLRNSSEGDTRTVWLDLALENDTVDEAVAHYIAIVDQMPSAMRSLWNACTDRCLNTGV